MALHILPIIGAAVATAAAVMLRKAFSKTEKQDPFAMLDIPPQKSPFAEPEPLDESKEEPIAEPELLDESKEEPIAEPMLLDKPKEQAQVTPIVEPVPLDKPKEQTQVTSVTEPKPSCEPKNISDWFRINGFYTNYITFEIAKKLGWHGDSKDFKVRDFLEKMNMSVVSKETLETLENLKPEFEKAKIRNKIFSWFHTNGFFNWEVCINFEIAKKLGWHGDSKDFKVRDFLEKNDWSVVSKKTLENLKPEFEKVQESHVKDCQNSCKELKRAALKKIEDILSNCDDERKILLRKPIENILGLLYNDYPEDNMASLREDILRLPNFHNNDYLYHFHGKDPYDLHAYFNKTYYESRLGIIYAYFLILRNFCDILKPEGKLHKFIKEIIKNYDTEYTLLGCCPNEACLSHKNYEQKKEISYYLEKKRKQLEEIQGNKKLKWKLPQLKEEIKQLEEKEEEIKTKRSFETREGTEKYIHKYRDEELLTSYMCSYGFWHVKTKEINESVDDKPKLTEKQKKQIKRLAGM